MSLDELNTILENIAHAKNTTELEQHFVSFDDYQGRQSNQKRETLWSDLRQINIIVEKRIHEIEYLEDLDEHIAQERVGNLFGRLALSFARIALYRTAVNFLIELWNKLGEFQATSQNGSHIYRAGIGYYLGQIYHNEREPGAAIWWLLHAHADDLLGGQHHGAAYDFLRLAFGVHDSIFEYMKACTNPNSDDEHPFFAEHLVVQLSLKPEFANLFSYPSSQPEFSVGRAYARSLLTLVEKENAEGKLEGQPLEELARYLVLLMAGWVPTKNIYHYRTEIDSDIVARYIREPESISNSYSRSILIECKNMKATLSVAETGYFLYRMYLTQVNVGILFTRKNVSGQGYNVTQDENATHLLDLAFQQNGAAVVVIDLDDLREVVEGKKTIWTTIDTGIVERRFGRPHQS